MVLRLPHFIRQKYKILNFLINYPHTSCFVNHELKLAALNFLFFDCFFYSIHSLFTDANSTFLIVLISAPVIYLINLNNIVAEYSNKFNQFSLLLALEVSSSSLQIISMERIRRYLYRVLPSSVINIPFRCQTKINCFTKFNWHSSLNYGYKYRFVN